MAQNKAETWAQDSGVRISLVAMSEDSTQVHCWCSQTPHLCSGRGTLLAWFCPALRPGSDLEKLLVVPAVAALGDHHPDADVVAEQPVNSEVNRR